MYYTTPGAWEKRRESGRYNILKIHTYMMIPVNMMIPVLQPLLRTQIPIIAGAGCAGVSLFCYYYCCCLSTLLYYS